VVCLFVDPQPLGAERPTDGEVFAMAVSNSPHLLRERATRASVGDPFQGIVTDGFLGGGLDSRVRDVRHDQARRRRVGRQRPAKRQHERERRNPPDHRRTGSTIVTERRPDRASAIRVRSPSPTNVPGARD
jgi:hypothetical protein